MPEPIRVYFLGTGAAAPFNLRRLPCVAVKYRGYLILFDVGEGAQYSLIEKRLRPGGSRLIICLTHFHADHTSGLPGLLHTLNLVGRRDEVTIIGPRGLREFFDYVCRAFLLGWFSYDVRLVEVTDLTRLVEVYRADCFSIYAFPTFHGPIPSCGYLFKEKDWRKFDVKKAEELGIPPGPLRGRLVRGETVTLPDGRVVRPDDVTQVVPGRKIAYTGDCSVTEDLVEYVRGADLLIAESSFSARDAHLAQERFHATARDVGELARKAGVRRVALVHISSRYSDVSELVAECREAAGEGVQVFAPNDGDVIEL